MNILVTQVRPTPPLLDFYIEMGRKKFTFYSNCKIDKLTLELNFFCQSSKLKRCRIKAKKHNQEMRNEQKSDASLDPGLLDSTEEEFPFPLIRYCIVYLSLITKGYD